MTAITTIPGAARLPGKSREISPTYMTSMTRKTRLARIIRPTRRTRIATLNRPTMM